MQLYVEERVIVSEADSIKKKKQQRFVMIYWNLIWIKIRNKIIFAYTKYSIIEQSSFMKDIASPERTDHRIDHKIPKAFIL